MAAAVYFGVGLAILLLTLGRPVKQYLHEPPDNRGDI